MIQSLSTSTSLITLMIGDVVGRKKKDVIGRFYEKGKL
jgi:hypothetical protein